ncbi:MAG: iron-containing alcohol dehydrogenase [Clostridiaceae bacterium]|nr:iron-containing alcohol dehydrogenase [Clostridiaceae bacterium]
MNNFEFQLATRIHFGKGEVEKSLAGEVLLYGKKILFVFDEIPAKASGLYEEVHEVCRKNGIEVTEFTGIEPNPRHTTVNRGAELLRQCKADCIVAAGGGSTIDCAKAVSFAVYHDGDVWDFYEHKVEIGQVKPVIAIPTLAASGAEVSFSSVISNLEKKKKIGLRNDKERPVAAILDPSYTFSVPKFHTACGIVDIMSHTYESYFDNYPLCMQDGFSEGIQKTCVDNGRKVMMYPEDYDARAQLMWAAVMSISHLTSYGRGPLYSPIHMLDHMVGAYYDIVHGAGIAILSIAWFKYCLSDKTAARFARWGKNVWDIDGNQSDYAIASQAIQAFEDFCEELGLPTRLSQVNVPKEAVKEIARDLYGTLPCDKWYRPVESERELAAVLSLAY